MVKVSRRLHIRRKGAGKGKIRKNPIKKTIRLYHIVTGDGGLEFWSIFPPIDDEKPLGTRRFPLPLREGFYGKDYLSDIDVDSIKEERALRK